MAKVLFIQENYFPFQSITRLSACLKHKGHNPYLAIGSPGDILRQIKKIRPDLIAFSVLTPYRNYMLSCANTIKESGITIPIVAGGYELTFSPELLEFSKLDIICRGEGDEALVELCDRIDAKADYSDIPNLWVKKENHIYKNRMRMLTANLDILPFEDRDIYCDYDAYFKMVPFTQVLAGRGCPYMCSYCFNHAYRRLYESEGSAGYCKFRSIGNIIEELLVLKSKYKARYIIFNDSTLTFDKQWLLNFLRQYEEKIRLPFSINTVITEIDEDIAKALADSRCCKMVRFGMETGNERFRQEILNKRITNQELINGAEILKKHGIRYTITIMFGLPGETMKLAWETIDLAIRISAKNSCHIINIFKPFPGLDITTFGIKIGQFNQDGVGMKGITRLIQRDAQTEFSEQVKYKNLPLGTKNMCFYESYRVDTEGRLLLKLSRFSHLAIRFPVLRKAVKFLIRFPDNFLYRSIWRITQEIFSIGPNFNLAFPFFARYCLFRRSKNKP